MEPTAVSDHRLMGPRLTDAVLEDTHSPLRREMATLWDTIFDNLPQSCEGKLTHIKYVRRLRHSGHNL